MNEELENVTGPQVMNYRSYGNPIVHVTIGGSVEFYASVCMSQYYSYAEHTHIINKVVLIPYLASELEPTYGASDYTIDECAVSEMRLNGASRYWIPGIQVTSPGSYMWIEQ
jgi:hypothetical protein